ncbi:MAG: hypothetical protein ACK4JX_01105 [Flavobacterium sp.]
MKKLLFTAIAVVGFGMNSWGHTINKDESNLISLNDPCHGMECYQQADANENPDNQDTLQWMKDVDNCLIARGCDPEFTRWTGIRKPKAPELSPN